MRVAIVGAGLIGERRARVASGHPDTELSVIVDVDVKKASRLANELGCDSNDNWGEVVSRSDVDIVIVATPNNILAPVSIAALKAGKHVLCEKPMATTLEDAELMVEAAKGSGAVLKVGYNLRHHPAIARARELLTSGAVGEPMFVRCCYGHGGRPEYEKEWRCNREISGGGELVDQGVHIIDLSRWFLGEFEEVYGLVTTAFWDIVPVEDNVFAVLKTTDGRVASFHASWTQWKNKFEFEVFGKKGYLIVDGLGGSYGPERLILGKRDSRNPPPKEDIFRFETGDISWEEEWNEFVKAIKSGREPLACGYDGLQVLRLVVAIYRSAERKEVARIKDTRVY